MSLSVRTARPLKWTPLSRPKTSDPSQCQVGLSCRDTSELHLKAIRGGARTPRPGETEAGSAGTQPDRGIAWPKACRKAFFAPRLAPACLGVFPPPPFGRLSHALENPPHCSA